MPAGGHHNCLEKDSETIPFSMVLQKRPWKVPKANNRTGLMSHARGARGRETNSRTAVPMKKAGRSQMRGRLRSAGSPTNQAEEDDPEPTKRTEQVTQGAGIPPTALKGSCT